MVRPLEPRFVLNATAELTSLGQLILTGDADADVVNLTELPDNSVLITDSSGAVIPIANHPGASTDPLPTSAITSGQILIDLGAGDDTLHLDLPSGLDVTLSDSGGADHVEATFSQIDTVGASNNIDLTAETIAIESGQSNIDFTNDNVLLRGDVSLGTIGATTNVNLGTGSLAVTGAIELSGNVAVFSNGGSVDWTSAVVSATEADADLSFRLNHPADASLTLGSFDRSAGFAVDDLQVTAASKLSTYGNIELSGDFSVQSIAQTVDVDSQIDAANIRVRIADSLNVDGDLVARDGVVLLQSNHSVTLSSSIDTSASGSAGQIDLIAPRLNFSDASLVTAGGNVSLIGDSFINGDVTIDSGNNAQSAAAGDVRIFGFVSGQDSAADRLNIQSIGLSNNGLVEIQDAIGGTSPGRFDLNNLAIAAGVIDLRAISVTGGDVHLSAAEVRMADTQWSVVASAGVGGNLQVDGALFLPSGSARIETSGDVQVTGEIANRNNAADLALTAGGNVSLASTVSGVNDLFVQSGNQTSFGGKIDIAGKLDVAATERISVSSSSIRAVETLVFRDSISFNSDVILDGASLRFDAPITTATGTTTTALARIVDPVNADPLAELQIIKSGEGALILVAANQYSAATLVQTGTLEVRGSISSDAAKVNVASGATLAGDGVIGAETIVAAGGTFSPGRSLGAETTSLVIGEVTFEAGAIYQVQLNGAVAGTQYDQLLLDADPKTDEVVKIDGAILDLQLNHSPPPASEFVIVRNDGVDAIQGRFSVNFDPNGNATATPRMLGEGELVRSPFGSQSESAFITYFGGDGNDIAIVTAGDVSIDADQITLIVRTGIDLEVRTGDSLAEAEAATPVVRPIAGLNNNELFLVDTPDDDLILIDVDGFADSTGNFISFTGTFVFDGNTSFSDNDRVLLFDSDPSTDDLPSKIDYMLSDDRNGTATVRIRDTEFDLRFSGLENLEQSIVADQIELSYSDASQQIVVSADTDAPRNTSVSGSSGMTRLTKLSIENPTDALSIFTGAGNDQVVVNDFGGNESDGSANALRASLNIDAQGGDDTLQFNADLNVGSDSSSGDVVLIAERLSLLGDIDTTAGGDDGSIQLVGGVHVLVAGDATLFTGNGSVQIDGNGGSVDTSNADLISQSNADAVTVANATTVLLGDIEVTTGRLVIGQDGDVIGAVTQAPSTSINVDRLSVSTISTVDLANAENQISSVDLLLSRGGLILVDSTEDLIVAGVDSGGADVRIDADGDLLLQRQAIIANGATVTLRTDGAIIDLGSGENSQNIQARVVNLSAGSSGIGRVFNAIDVIASQSINATTDIFGGDIYLANVGGQFLVGQINAGEGNVSLTADEIVDATDDSLADIIGTDLVVTAINGIGNSARIELQNVDTLTASTTSGGIDFDWSADSDTRINQLTADTGDIRLDQSGNQRMEIVNVRNDKDSVQITNRDESIDVIGNSSSDIAISAGADGFIALNAQGDDSDLFVRRGLATAQGDIDLSADRNAIFGTNGDITSLAGNLSVTADNRLGDRFGVISMVDGAVFDTGVGEISLATDGDVGVASLVTANQGESAVMVRSKSGRITDRGDAHLDINASNGTTTLHSRLGTGDGNALETDLSVLDSQVTRTGATEINELSEIALRNVNTADGLIDVRAGGTITATLVVSQNTSGFDDVGQLAGEGSRDIQLIARGSQSDVLVGIVRADRSADVILVADDDVLDTDTTDEQRVIADDLFVQSNNAQGDQDIAILLSTNINDASLLVTGSVRGDVVINEVDSVNLASADSQADAQRVETSNGEIRVFAGESISVSDANLQNDSATRLSDVEIVAGGENGRISLLANESIILGDGVQIDASQSTIDAVVIEASDVFLGEQFQISTGLDVGVARVFAPRPSDFDVKSDLDTAFFDPTSVSTNILEQAAVNDAEGRLTVDIGNEGERGLTINVDWGAQTNRFQQIDNLSGDAEPLVVSHVYLEGDILDSRLNDRVSETAPLNVKFSVRHHESIRVIGDTITQGESGISEVAGRTLSSTDNRLTAQGESAADLESGTAAFVIPSLSIPVAFFPTRDVIPKLTEPVIFVQSQETITLSQSNFTTVESSVSTSVARPEYFQIRALSPDPDGGDLTAPEQLPDDILDGNKLRDLFESLPDGRYEIEYVLGDGNERSILQVDLRRGRPIIESDDLDGGPLRMREVEGSNDAKMEAETEEDIDKVKQKRREQDVGERARNPNQKSVPAVESEDESGDNVSAPARIEMEPILAGVGIATGGMIHSRKRTRSGYFSAGQRFLRRSKNTR